MSKVKFLVVDDANFIRDLIKKTIRDHFPGHETDEAIDGKKAQNLLQKKSYDLVISDWEMPNMSGAQLLTWLRQESPNPKTPFIMVTSRGDRDHIKAAITHGVNEYIVKPFNNEQLVSKVTKILKKFNKIDDSQIDSGSNPFATGLGGDSLSALTSQSNATPQQSNTSNQTAVKTAQPKNKKKAMGQLQLRTDSFAVECLVLNMSLADVQCIAKFIPEQLPSIGQPIVMDIAQKNDKDDIARINGYVSGLTCREKEYPPKFITLDIVIVDEDEDKRQFLQRFISGS